MGQVTDQVRTFVGESEIEQAIDHLAGFLKQVGGDLYDQIIHQRGLFKAWQRDRMLGTANNQEEKNRISLAILKIASQIDKLGLEDPIKLEQYKKRLHGKGLDDEDEVFDLPEKFDVAYEGNTPHQPLTAPEQVKYQAQCFFTGDMMAYYITKDDQIVAVNPLTNQRLIVGVKMPSQNFNFAWTFFVNATGIYYLVDHAGIIWGQNFGMPVQVGYVKYFH